MKGPRRSFLKSISYPGAYSRCLSNDDCACKGTAPLLCCRPVFAGGVTSIRPIVAVRSLPFAGQA